jgi:hypothetical protein
LLQHTRVPVLTEVLSGVEEDEQDDDRPRPDRIAVVPHQKIEYRTTRPAATIRLATDSLRNRPLRRTARRANASSDSVIA